MIATITAFSTGQALDVQALLLAHGDLGSAVAAGRLETQAAVAFFLGHLARIKQAGGQVTVAAVADDRDHHGIFHFAGEAQHGCNRTT